MQLQPVVMTIGIVLCAIAATMLLPAAVDLSDGHAHWKVFLASSMFTFFIGGLLLLSALNNGSSEIGIREGFLLTTTTWVTVAAFSAIPFVGLGLGLADAFFESMSGLTTMGATIMVSLDNLPRGILLWRSLLQGLGGLGIVVTAIIVLPFLRVGGMQLFQRENSDRSEKVLPRALELVSATAAIYTTLLIACMLLYIMFGMTLFDAVCHALTTVATGGFSTHDKSFGFFQEPALHWIAIVFMLLGALPFVVFIRLLNGDRRALWHDEQVRGFLVFTITIALIVSLWLMVTRNMPAAEAFRLGTFNVVSIITTTGYASDDYSQWGSFAVGLFFLLMFIGGCSGSTAPCARLPPAAAGPSLDPV